MESIYPRRLPSRWVRFLQVEPGSGPDPIRVALREASIDDPPAFEALSYVWGDPSQRGHLQCSGQEVSVTRSLSDALRNVRLPDRELLIWADALCINQDDLEERADQVRLMREVYSRAANVVVWLGLDAEGRAGRAIALIETIHRACADHALAKGVGLLDMAHFTPAARRSDGLAGVSVADVAAAAGRTGRPAPDAEGWAALGWVLARPWFTRVWCVQEVVLARSSRVRVGARSVDWVRVGVAAAWLGEQSLAADYDVPAELEGLRWDNAYSMFDTDGMSGLGFLEILVAFRDFDATNSRDKVYGLLGLVGEAALDGFGGVDYRKSVVDVYVDVVKMSVASSQSLACLCYTQHGEVYEREDEFPSWVPRWDLSRDVSSILTSLSVTAWEEGDKHWLPGLAGFNPSADGKVALSGVRFDTIKWTTDALDVEHFKEDISPSEASGHPFLEIWHRASSNKSYALFPSESDEHPFAGILELALTLTTGFTDGYEQVTELESEQQNRFYSDYLAYTRLLFDRAGTSPRTFDPLDIALCDGDAARFRVAASRSCDQRRVFETAAGFYGLAPACAREGDVVVLLYGGPVPFVLRQAGDGWVFLGDGFVGPLMPESADETVRDRFGAEEVFVLV